MYQIKDKFKKRIYYARYGRTIKFSKKIFFLQFLLFVLFFEFILLNNMGFITYHFSNITANYLNNPRILGYYLVFIHIFYVFTDGRLPTFQESLIVLIFSFVFMLLLLKTRKDLYLKVFSMWLIYICIILMASSLFFILFPLHFPYGIKDFSLLYMESQVGVWLMIPILFSLSTSLFSFNFLVVFSNFIVIILTLLYSFLFSIIRYILFLVILEKYSFLWMAIMFFAFGPLMDFIYISGIFSYYVSFLSKKYSKSFNVYQWIY